MALRLAPTGPTSVVYVNLEDVGTLDLCDLDKKGVKFELREPNTIAKLTLKGRRVVTIQVFKALSEEHSI